jgi:subtilisin family serine protease
LGFLRKKARQEEEMNRRGPWKGFWISAVLVFSLLCGLTRSAVADGTVRGYVLVRLQPGVAIEAITADYNTTVREQVPGTPIYALNKPAGIRLRQFAERLSADARLVYAETDTYAGSPEVKGKQFHFAFDAGPNAGGYVNQTAYTQVNFGATSSLSTGAGVIVAVLDTGATFDHPDLAGKYLPGYNAIKPSLPPNDIADGAKNYAVGHGTMVAGIIARLAPDARILPVRVLNGDGKGTMLNVAKGILFAVGQGAKVLSMSFGSARRSSALNDALDMAESAGVVMVASVGNDNAEREQYPAVGKGALAVASVEATNVKSSYSNYGSFVRVVAPGSGIRSAYYTGGYASWSGTSFAVPFVSAEAVLILGANPALTEDRVKELIRDTARSVDEVNPLYEGRLGKGLIDIEAAVRRAN